MTFFARASTSKKYFDEGVCYLLLLKHASIGSSPFEVVLRASELRRAALAFAEFQGGRWGFSGNVAPLTPLGRKSLAPDSTLSTSSFDDKFSLKSGTPNQHRLLHRLLTFCLYRSAKFIYGSLENVRRSCDPS